MKHKHFYLYQLADVIFTSSCRATGMLLAWVLIQQHQLKAELGWLLSASWLLQVLTLLLMGLYADHFSKKTIPVFCSAVGFLCLMANKTYGSVEPLQLSLVCLTAALLGIVIQPIGASIVPSLYTRGNTEHAYRIRGFVNSINTVLGVAISGFLISTLSTEGTLSILTVSVGISFLLFACIKTADVHAPVPSTRSYSAIRALVQNKVERILVVVSAVSNCILTPVLIYVTPILIIDRYGYTALEVGLSEAMFGMGMFLGSLLLCKKMNGALGVRRSTVLSVIMVGAGLLLIPWIDSIHSLYIGLFIAGAGVVVYNINTTQIRCSATPPNARNSFESVFLAACILPIPAGVALSTLMVNSGHLELTLTLFSMLILLSALAVWLCKDFSSIVELNDEELDSHYLKLYPKAYSS